jgi:hypothetical protein
VLTLSKLAPAVVKKIIYLANHSNSNDKHNIYKFYSVLLHLKNVQLVFCVAWHVLPLRRVPVGGFIVHWESRLSETFRRVIFFYNASSMHCQTAEESLPVIQGEGSLLAPRMFLQVLLHLSVSCTSRELHTVSVCNLCEGKTVPTCWTRTPYDFHRPSPAQRNREERVSPRR